MVRIQVIVLNYAFNVLCHVLNVYLLIIVNVQHVILLKIEYYQTQIAYALHSIKNFSIKNTLN